MVTFSSVVDYEMNNFKFFKGGLFSLMIRAEYLITTPLFMGGAANDGNARPELRAPSIKGLLRFWFRATALPSLGTLEKVWEKERELFGSTDGQGKFLLSANQSSGLTIAGPNTENLMDARDHGLKYLGYRTYGSRKFFKPGGRFTVALELRKRKNLKATDEDREFLKNSLIALGLFGGAGSRSRRGFGSLTLTNLEIGGEQVWKRPTSIGDLEKCIRTFISELNIAKGSREAKLPPYTSFSELTKISIIESEENESILEFLNRIGEKFREHRKEVGDKNGDVILIKRFLKGDRINNHPSRAVFGLPHNYFLKNIKKSATVEPSGSENKRRASPLLIHIHALNKDRFAAVLTLLPAVFLPNDKKITVREIVSKKKMKVLDDKYEIKKEKVDQKVEFELIEDFLNKLEVVWP